MTLTPAPVGPTPGLRPRRVRQLRGEGQWAAGHREPLNPSERIKRDDAPLNVRDRIENIYAHRGFQSIDPDDLHGRFRWLGLYTQRRPGIDGGRTGVLQPHELSDEHFMLRIRVDGGQLDLHQLRTVAHLSATYARDTADITDRQNIQLHWVRIEDVPTIWRLLEKVGLSTIEACGDCPRVICGSPVAGVAEAEVLDPSSVIRQIVDTYVGHPDYADLPRKFKTSIAWLPDTPYEVNDLSFLGVIHPEHGPGFDVWVGGGLSTAPRLAERLGAWVPMHEVPDVWAAIVRLFRDHGYRRLRHRARLKFLVADWGVGRFREILERDYLGRVLVDGPAPQLPERPVDHVGVHRQWDGRCYVGGAPLAGRMSGTLLGKVADVAEAHGSARVRLTPYQKLLVLDVPQERTADLTEALTAIGLPTTPSTWRRNTMACTGIEFCKLAVVETKARAARLVGELERRLADLDVELSINVNGCPNGCARTQVADIGLKGQLVPGPDGELVEGFQIHLGGGLALTEGQASGFGRKLRGLRTTAADLPDYVERVARSFARGRSAGETFPQWVLRADETDLR